MKSVFAALAAGVLCVGVAAPANAAPKQPRPGDFTCTDSAEATVAVLSVHKGNKYSVDGGEKGKYVFKTGQHKMKFKTGDYHGLYYGVWDKGTKTLTLHQTSDDAAWAACSKAVAEEPPTEEPTEEG